MVTFHSAVLSLNDINVSCPNHTPQQIIKSFASRILRMCKIYARISNNGDDAFMNIIHESVRVIQIIKQKFIEMIMKYFITNHVILEVSRLLGECPSKPDTIYCNFKLFHDNLYAVAHYFIAINTQKKTQTPKRSMGSQHTLSNREEKRQRTRM